MSTDDTSGRPDDQPGPPGGQAGIPWRWLLRAAIVPAVLLLGGGALMAKGLLAMDGGPHPQPLPARNFAIAPAAARALKEPARLARPQRGSIQDTCVRLPAGQPQVAIPSLCVYAPLVAARIAGGDLVIPRDVHLAGLDTSSAPLTARYGTTIIAGHVDNYSQGDGVFYFLYAIAPGALITITSPGHAVTTWRAYKVAVTNKDRLPSDIWSLTGPHRLVLVTCGGPLERTPDGNSYADNVLIYATPDNPVAPAKAAGARHHHARLAARRPVRHRQQPSSHRHQLSSHRKQLSSHRKQPRHHEGRHPARHTRD